MFSNLFDFYIATLFLSFIIIILFKFLNKIQFNLLVLLFQNYFLLFRFFYQFFYYIFNYFNDKINNYIINLSGNCFKFIKFDQFKYWSTCDCYTNYDDEEKIFNEEEYSDINYEINKFTHSVLTIYIDIWYNRFPTGGNFRNYLTEYFNLALLNFYKLSKFKVSKTNFIIDSLDNINQCLSDKNFAHLTKDDEAKIYSNFLDYIFIKALPQDINPPLTGWKISDNNSTLKPGLFETNNSIRLMVFNLLIYSLVLPFIKKLTDPLYILYNILYLFSLFGGISLNEFVAVYDTNANERYSFIEAFNIENKKIVNVRMKSNPIDKHTSLVFHNLNIIEAKVSTTQILNLSKINRYIDYVIGYTILIPIKNGDDNYDFMEETYQVNRRFSEFLTFQYKLEDNEVYRDYVIRLKKKPSNIYFHLSTFLNFLNSNDNLESNSALVLYRQRYLQNFLSDLSSIKAINVSPEFCEFLGYKHKNVLDIKEILDKMPIKNETNTFLNPIINLEYGLNKMKNFFMTFISSDPIIGKLSSHISHKETKSNKYSIMEINVENNGIMLIKNKLNFWCLKDDFKMENHNDEFVMDDQLDKSLKDPIPMDDKNLFFKITKTFILLVLKNNFLNDFFTNKIHLFLTVLLIK